MSSPVPCAPAPDPARAMYALVEELYPVCRSITGDGVRATLAAIGARIPLHVHEVPSGAQVFDWVVPREWNIRDAWIKDSRGRKLVDFRISNLHVLNYSVPVHRKLSLAELRGHLYSLPEQPDWIPYRTSYYEERWGFCLRQRDLDLLVEDEYEVLVDATLEPGHLSYAECLVPGASSEEVLLSCHVCHPSLCNDNLSGIALCTQLASHLASSPRRYSYRVLFLPGTIGAITWLARNPAAAARIRHGLVVANVGDAGNLHYKRSRSGDTEIDRAVAHVLSRRGAPFGIEDFSPWGYDERQYCSPGIDLAVGCLTRTPHGRYPQYHTSADDLSFVQARFLGDSFDAYLAVIGVLEGNRRYRNLSPFCEPQLGRRGLYRSLGGEVDSREAEQAMLWVLNLSDGRHDLLAIADRAQLPFAAVEAAAGTLCTAGLLQVGV